MNPKGMNETGKRRLRALLLEHKVNMKQASLAAGLGATYVRDTLEKDRGGNAASLTKLATYFSVSLEFLMGEGVGGDVRERRTSSDPETIRIVGRVGAGVWYELDTNKNYEVFKAAMFPPDPRFSVEAQFDLEVTGTSLDRIAREGELLRCVDFAKAKLAPQNGDMVIVYRTKNGHALQERTAKYYFEGDGRKEMRPCSDDPRWQQSFVVPASDEDPDTIEVKALVLYAYRSVGRGRL